MFVSSVHFVSQDPLQESCLRFMSWHPPIWILYKIHIFGFMSQHLCVSGSSAKSMSLDSCLGIHVYLRILYKIHASGSKPQQPYVSQDPSQDPRLRIHVSASLYLTDSLQDPCLQIHVAASLYLTILCKIHVSGSMCPIHVLASTNMDPLQDPCLRIHVSASLYLRLQDPCLRIHVSASTKMDPLQDPRLRIHVSASLYLRLLCKIHVSGSVYKHPYVSQDPLQDPCLRIHISASICISGTSANPCLRIRI